MPSAGKKRQDPQVIVAATVVPALHRQILATSHALAPVWLGQFVYSTAVEY